MASNLELHRGGENIWTRKPAHHLDAERLVTGALAAAFLAAGLRRRTCGGLMLAASGVTLAWWAFAPSDERRARWEGIRRLRPAWFGGGEDEVTEASEESFPASDAPSWTSSAAEPDYQTRMR